eukprot:GHVQ01030142.1.p1 GENE.GHVQ01030142.1~~GHVQ01030142.1.p1  ORF type:complete len:247 (-),score=34.47 GHVQ01030142.1:125-865(-)
MEMMSVAASDACVPQLMAGLVETGGQHENGCGNKAVEVRSCDRSFQPMPNSCLAESAATVSNHSAVGSDRPVLAQRYQTLLFDSDRCGVYLSWLTKDSSISAASHRLASVIPPDNVVTARDEGHRMASFIGVKHDDVKCLTMLPRITIDTLRRLTAVLMANQYRPLFSLPGPPPVLPLWPDSPEFKCFGAPNYNWVGCSLNWVPQRSTFKQDGKDAHPRLEMKGWNGEKKTVFTFATPYDQEMQGE